jgi:hypothetical protein
MTATDDDDDEETATLKAAAGKLLTASSGVSPPPIVYHYTSLDTAIKILDSREMWCANVAFSNDPSEGTYGQEVIADVCAHDPDLKMEGAQKLVADNLDGYAVSFSSEPNELTQWRAYCSNGRGVAIGIDTGVLSQRKTVTFSHVEYEPERQKAIVQSLLDLFRAPLLSARSQRDDDRIHRLAYVLTLSFVIVRAMLKNSAYHSEKEYRLLDALPKDPAEHSTTLKTFQRGEFFVPFFPVDLRASSAPGADQPVRDVWLGPCLDVPSATAAIEATAAYVAQAFPIHVSTVPMRCEQRVPSARAHP